METAGPVMNSLGGMVVFGAVGLFCLMRPRLIQQWTIARHSREGSLNRLNPFREFVKSDEYILSVRVTGALGVVVAVLCAYALVANLFNLH